MIAFKTASAEKQWPDAHCRLREVVDWLDLYVWPPELDFVITRVADRDSAQVTEIHTCGPPHRACDIRTLALPWAEAKKIERRINADWSYDHTRPDKQVAWLHRPEGGTWHLHLQVHPNTTFSPATET